MMTKIPSPYKFKKAFWALSVACSFLLVFYVSLVGKTVSNVLERQQDEQAIQDVSANVSKFEFSYLNEKASINVSFARSLGFVDVENTSVAKQAKVGVLPVNNEIQ